MISVRTASLRRHVISLTRRGVVTRTSNATLGSSNTNAQSNLVLAMGMGAALVAASACLRPSSVTSLDVARIPTSGDVLMLGPTKEKSTGILFPVLCNGYTLVGAGVRLKWGLVKVYAVGTYMDPVAMSAVKKQPKDSIAKALLDPMYPRTIRIVMARNLSAETYAKGIIDAIQPRLNGEDLDKLDEFKNLNPPIDLVQGAEIEMTIRGDTLLYKNATGGMGIIKSAPFCRALCEVYYGADPVSPTHKDAVVDGIPSL